MTSSFRQGEIRSTFDRAIRNENLSDAWSAAGQLRGAWPRSRRGAARGAGREEPGRGGVCPRLVCGAASAPPARSRPAFPCSTGLAVAGRHRPQIAPRSSVISLRAASIVSDMGSSSVGGAAGECMHGTCPPRTPRGTRVELADHGGFRSRPRRRSILAIFHQRCRLRAKQHHRAYAAPRRRR
jgi:hypothetical protein